ncbi:MAG: AmmeMemoRadiSam system protein B, partial [Candidatus Thorarchaeota archaeon]
MRKPIVAGKFYPERRAELEREVKKLLSKKKQEVKLAIVPHAGYDFSGKLMGEVLGMMKEKKTFIILGVNHSGFGEKLAFSSEDFSTPLGVVKNNKILGKKIIGKLNGVVDAGINDLSHSQEHSIEVLLPFLQLSQRKFDIVPILLRNLEYEGCKEV